LDGFHLPHGFRRALARLDFAVTVDMAFDDVVAGCADRAETWIDPAIARVYTELHAQGSAHSVEVWAGGRLAGGLYGVQLGGVFFGESMFSRVSEASKVALLALVGILRAQGFGLLDIQWVTDHLENFGAAPGLFKLPARGDDDPAFFSGARRGAGRGDAAATGGCHLAAASPPSVVGRQQP
jgi:leucyl/phenylalanyl-tRNA--protein transferase